MWLGHRVYIWSELPQGERTCCRVPLADLHIAQLSSAVKPHCLWLARVRRLQVERSRKDKARDSIAISEDPESYLDSSSSQLIGAHCLAWPAAVATFFFSSIVLNLVMTMFLWCQLNSRENHRCGELLPKPALLVWVAPMTSLLWRLASASYTAIATDHMVPVLPSGCMCRMTSWIRKHHAEPSFYNLEFSLDGGEGGWGILVAV